MFAAGTDTTFITIDLVIAELIRNPKAMKKFERLLKVQENLERKSLTE